MINVVCILMYCVYGVYTNLPCVYMYRMSLVTRLVRSRSKVRYDMYDYTVL